MKGRSICSLVVLCAAALCAACGGLSAAQTIKGTVVSSTSGSVVVQPDGTGGAVLVKPPASATVMRGQTGAEIRKAKIGELAPGDRVVVVVNQDGKAGSVKAYYAVARGTCSSTRKDKVFLRDGRWVKLSPSARVVLADGKVGKVADLKDGTPLVCRLNPTTNQAWMVVATKAAPAPKAVPKLAVAPVTMAARPSTSKVKGYTELAVAPVFPAAKAVAKSTVFPTNSATKNAPAVHPIIKSVTYVAPSPLKAKDWMRIDMTGTPGGRAICEVKGLIPRTVMKETSPGCYRASVMVPSGKLVHNEPVLGHLTFDCLDAPTVQASRLINVAALEPVTPPEPVVAAKPEPEPAPAEAVPPVPTAAVEAVPAPPPAPVVEPPKPEPPKVKAPVVVTSPEMGAKILRSLVVTGAAEPSSNVMVTVTYSNGLGGVLNLSGQVISQLIAAGSDGHFQMGPIALEGPLATKGLVFTVKARYPEAEQSGSVVSVLGDRS